MLRLVIANLNYSSWSMRAYLALTVADAEFMPFDVGMKTKPGWKDSILSFSGAGKVPVLIDGNLSIHESLAIAEWAHERYPQAKLWPEDAALRARGRAISSEMSSSFLALRNHLPVNLRGRAKRTPDAPGVQEDIERVNQIFEASLGASSGDYLLGSFSIADCMYFPVLSRFRTYGVPLSDTIARYSAVMFAHPAVKILEEVASGTEPIAEYDGALDP